MGKKKDKKCGHVKTSLCKDILKVKIRITNSDIGHISVLYMTRKGNKIYRTYKLLKNKAQLRFKELQHN